MVAIDGSKFKAANSRDRNYTTGKIDELQQQIEESVQLYLDLIDSADRTSPTGFDVKTVRLYEKIASLRQQMRKLDQVRKQLKKQPDKQLSMTDPDARSMATSGRGSGIVGYNVQTAVDTKHHLIVAHEVTNVGNDHGQLSRMATSAKNAMGKARLKVVADRGYYSGPEIRACDLGNIKLLVESAWSYRDPARVSIDIQRHEGLPKPIIDRAWEARPTQSLTSAQFSTLPR